MSESQPKPGGPQDRFRRQLGYRFRDDALLDLALTHRSCGTPDNERLEFLGDALLNFVIAEQLFLDRPKAAEGELSRLRAGIVCEATLARVARGLNLGDVLKLGPGELRSGGFRRESILADALEAILGAIHLDGGFDAARSACRQLFETEINALLSLPVTKDAKTRLQELLQATGRPLPVYDLLSEEGPSHHRHFKVLCVLTDSAQRSEGEGSSLKLAQQASAEAMLALEGAVPRQST